MELTACDEQRTEGCYHRAKHNPPKVRLSRNAITLSIRQPPDVVSGLNCGMFTLGEQASVRHSGGATRNVRKTLHLSVPFSLDPAPMEKGDDFVCASA
ncbi:hypothetical protein AVEN_93805-1 [Araneus ventricosus]|uniref:Uncharacterized protein n=1 Tax=Araneus ventricosus TaxID=182803 RepID=A0A4Y2AXG4_ARAVE|nr:hypothetical protein AVEN_93805-1 [Araneus ventricosus]